MEGAFLNDEPQTLLRIELREPSVYNSILEAISNGCNKIREIADRIHEVQQIYAYIADSAIN